MCMLLLHVWSTWSLDIWTQMAKGKPGSDWWKSSKFPLNWFAQRTVWDTMEREAKRLFLESSKSHLTKDIPVLHEGDLYMLIWDFRLTLNTTSIIFYWVERLFVFLCCQSWLESNIFSLFICGELIAGHWGDRDQADTFSFGPYKTAWPGWFGFLLCTTNTIFTVVPPSIKKFHLCFFSSRYWRKTQISKLMTHLRKSSHCSNLAKMKPLNASSGRYLVFSFILP